MKREILVGLAVALLGIWVGCSKTSSPTAPQSQSGTLQINMIDSPASYDQVNIVVDSVQAHIATSDSTSGWYTLNSTPATYDLLTLVNGANAILGSSKLPVGQYSQIRLFIGTGSNIVVNGTPIPLTTPSGAQSGVKLNVDATVQADVTYVLTIDFDAAQSVVATGNPNNPTYILKPVIRAVATATTGSIAGKVAPDSSMPVIWATSSQDTVSTYADTTGGFKLSYLIPATYSVTIMPKDTSYRDTTLTGITVTAGATTSLGTITLQPK